MQETLFVTDQNVIPLYNLNPDTKPCMAGGFIALPSRRTRLILNFLSCKTEMQQAAAVTASSSPIAMGTATGIQLR